MIIYSAEYCENIYESSFGVISLHKTKQGAYFAMRKHKLKTWDEDQGVLWCIMKWSIREYNVEEE